MSFLRLRLIFKVLMLFIVIHSRLYNDGNLTYINKSIGDKLLIDFSPIHQFMSI